VCASVCASDAGERDPTTRHLPRGFHWLNFWNFGYCGAKAERSKPTEVLGSKRARLPGAEVGPSRWHRPPAPRQRSAAGAVKPENLRSVAGAVPLSADGGYALCYRDCRAALQLSVSSQILRGYKATCHYAVPCDHMPFVSQLRIAQMDIH